MVEGVLHGLAVHDGDAHHKGEQENNDQHDARQGLEGLKQLLPQGESLLFFLFLLFPLFRGLISRQFRLL